jgi:EXS family
VFAITALEIVRRFQWVFFRVENEWSKMTQKHILELSEAFKEEDRLLGSGSYNI